MAKKNINSGNPPLVWSTVEQAFNDINDNFTEIYLNIQGTDSSDPVDLTNLSTDIAPRETGTYDLGSNSKRWQDLFLDNQLRIQNAIIYSPDGTTVDLPANSTVDGVLIKDPVEASFKTISISGQDDIVAEDGSDTLTMVGSSIAITTNATTDTLTFTNTGVTSLSTGTGIGVSSGTGAVTISNTGVTSTVAGNGITVSSGTGAVTISNAGVVEITADSGIQIFDDGGGTFRIRNSSPNVVQNVFRTVAVSGQNDIVADTSLDTLTFAEDTGIQITTNDTTDTITIANTGVTSVAASGGIGVTSNTGSVTISNTGVTGIAAGSGISVDASTGNVTVSNSRLGFTSMAVAGQDPILADTVTDTMVFVAGDGIVLTTDAGTDSLTIAVTPELLNIETTFDVAVVGADSVISTINVDTTLTFVAGTNITLDSDADSGVITISSTASGGGGGGGDFELFVAADDSTVYPINSGNTLQIDGAGGITASVDADGTFTIDGSGVAGLMSRTAVAGTTSSIADEADEDLNLTGYKGYLLLKIQTSAAAWVRIYTDAASRTADAGRSELTDPDPGAGVVAEVISTGAETILISPGAIGYNDEGTPTTNIPINVKNKSGGSAAITVTLTVIQVEA